MLGTTQKQRSQAGLTTQEKSLGVGLTNTDAHVRSFPSLVPNERSGKNLQPLGEALHGSGKNMGKFCCHYWFNTLVYQVVVCASLLQAFRIMANVNPFAALSDADDEHVAPSFGGIVPAVIAQPALGLGPPGPFDPRARALQLLQDARLNIQRTGPGPHPLPAAEKERVLEQANLFLRAAINYFAPPADEDPSADPPTIAPAAEVSSEWIQGKALLGESLMALALLNVSQARFEIFETCYAPALRSVQEALDAADRNVAIALDQGREAAGSEAIAVECSFILHQAQTLRKNVERERERAAARLAELEASRARVMAKLGDGWTSGGSGREGRPQSDPAIERQKLLAKLRLLNGLMTNIESCSPVLERVRACAEGV